MKKLVLLASVLVFGLSSVQADVLKGKAVEEISTATPKEEISITVAKKFNLGGDIVLKKGYILTGKMINVTEPEQWHHNASFTFIPTSYTDLDGKKHEITKEIKATYRQKMKADLAHSEITVGNTLFSPAYINDTKRIINGEAKEVWNDYSNRTTPWGKGEQIDIKSGETIYFNFPD